MRRSCLSVIVFLVLAAAAARGAWAGGRWTAPAIETAPAQLPMLGRPLVLDADLDEWDAGACVPMRYRSYLDTLKPPHEWRGPADAGMEFYCAWNSDGLCLAAVVADDDVYNDREIPADGSVVPYWQQDCVEIFVDGRVGDEFMKPPYSHGAYQVLIRPPTAERPAAIAANPRDGVIDGMEIAARRTAAGYVVEAFIPWTAFPEFSPQPGAVLGLQFRLDDYDTRDGDGVLVCAMSYRAAEELWRSPQRFVKWVLVDQPEAGPEVPLGPLAALEAAGAFGDRKAPPISVEVGSALADRVGSVGITAADAEGTTVVDRRAKVSRLPAPWGRSVRARANWPGRQLPDGYYNVTAVVYDKRGVPLGRTSRPVVFISSALVREFESRIEDAEVARLARSEPFRAAAYVGVAASVERLKRGMETANMTAAAQTARETAARLDVLDDGALTPGDWGICDLLALAGDPEAQVVVEYLPADRHPNSAFVSFYWGAIPLAAANVTQYSDQAEAASVLHPPFAGILQDPEERTTVAGLPARVVSRVFRFAPSSWAEFSADTQVLVVSNTQEIAAAIDPALLPFARVDAAAILPDCPAAIRDIVEAWAKRATVPVMDLAEAIKKGRLLIAGDARATEFADRLERRTFSTASLVERAPHIMVAMDERVITVESPSREFSEQIIGLITSGRPVTVADVDALRARLVAAVAPEAEPAVPVPGMELFCGDLHMHTFYSDGRPSPVGLALQAIHCYLDFAAITDHNTIEGAMLAQRLLAEHGIRYPLTVGEEITMEWAHMNAYPLKEVISWQLPAYEIIKAAHKQGAVIQLNHPGWPASEWSREHTQIARFARTGIDAWEHLPDKYHEWKQAGLLPVLTGTTDTHSGTFHSPERTIVLAPTPQGDDVAEAVRRGKVGALHARGSELLYGPDEMIGLVWSALAEGDALKAATAERLRAALEGADLIALLRASEPRPVRSREAFAK